VMNEPHTHALEILIRSFRHDFNPVGIHFVFDESKISNLAITHHRKSKLLITIIL
jgi:hypothetical protein